MTSATKKARSFMVGRKDNVAPQDILYSNFHGLALVQEANIAMLVQQSKSCFGPHLCNHLALLTCKATTQALLSKTILVAYAVLARASCRY